MPKDKDNGGSFWNFLGGCSNFEKKVIMMLQQLIDGGKDMSEAMDRLKREVAETKTAAQSALTLLAKLAQMIRDNATDPAALNAMADDLDAQQTEIAAAVVANDPDQPQPTE